MTQSPLNREAISWSYAILLVVVAAGVGLGVATIVDDELAQGIQKAVLMLIAGGLIGGVLKILLDDVVAARKRWDDAQTFVTNILGDLKEVHDRVERARLLIPAHQSAKTYGDELRDLLGSRVQLLNVHRALKTRNDVFRQDMQEKLEPLVHSMTDYLGDIATEFKNNYKDISNAQASYEVAVKATRSGVGGGATTQPHNTPWEKIQALPTTGLFLRDSSEDYEKRFTHPLDKASALLREELVRILRRERASAQSLTTYMRLLRNPSEPREPVRRRGMAR